MNNSPPSDWADRESIRELITGGARALDAEEFDDYIAGFAENARYRLETSSPEIGREMVWLDLDRSELAALLAEKPEHVNDIADRTHLVNVDKISLVGDAAQVIATFSVFRTGQRGATEIYAVGRYEDRMERSPAGWRIIERRVRTTTRMFPTPTPTPL